MISLVILFHVKSIIKKVNKKRHRAYLQSGCKKLAFPPPGEGGIESCGWERREGEEREGKREE